jgi:activator of 2-hydroxyglutaryl-CoA dehydratase
MERVEGKVVATGGVVAHHPMVVALLERALGTSVLVPEHAQETGAIGVAMAALAARAGDEASHPEQRDLP